MKKFHTNTLSTGPSYVYRLRSGRRISFRANEIVNVKNGHVNTIYGQSFAVVSETPDEVLEGERTLQSDLLEDR